jgi:hypothetical protein
MVGVVGGLVVMGVAMVGLYWDVAWHVDFGRDTEAFTTPHLLVVVGQLALVGVAIVTVLCATADAAPVRLRLWGLRIPWSAVLLVAFRLGVRWSSPSTICGTAATGSTSPFGARRT